jgi:hypothetical protein
MHAAVVTVSALGKHTINILSAGSCLQAVSAVVGQTSKYFLSEHTIHCVSAGSQLQCGQSQQEGNPASAQGRNRVLQIWAYGSTGALTEEARIAFLGHRVSPGQQHLVICNAQR